MNESKVLGSYDNRPARIVETYPGGKGAVGVYQSLINCIPPHETYIEAFLGGGAILRHKRRAIRNIGIDFNDEVISAWKQLDIPWLELIQGDAIEILQNWPWHDTDAARTLLYCDPPYLGQVRHSRRKIYKHELRTIQQHSKLLQILLRLPCMVLISGYACSLYDSLIGHWRQVQFSTTNRAGQQTIETVWLNFPAPSALHDYRYLGESFRERELIKRKRRRWLARFSKLSDLEREAVLSDIREL